MALFARSTALRAVVSALSIAPLVAALGFLHGQDWAPVHDMAWTELRVRDVGSANTPLVGLPGRLGHADQPGSHPGPLSFYLLAPVYRLLGASGWALEVSCALLNAIAIALSVWIAGRRAAAAGALGAGVGIGLLVLGYDLSLLTEPWNPNFPVLWFAAFLLALWSVLCADLALLPLLVVTGSICAQTHVPYVAVCGALGAVGVLAALGSALRSAPGSIERRRRLSWIVLACSLLLLLWAPPFIDELLHEPGNLKILAGYFASPPSEPLGVRQALPLVLKHLDAWFIVVHGLAQPGGFSRFAAETVPEPWRGGASAAIWMTCALFTIRLRLRRLLLLHAALAAGLAVGLVSVSRIFGAPWPYLMYWAWTLGVSMIVASAASVVAALRERLGEMRRRRFGVAASWLALAAVAVCALRSILVAPNVTPGMGYRAGKQLRALLPDTVAALQAGAAGRAGRYLVTWSDALHAGAQAYGLLNELERAGYQVGVRAEHARLAGKHRVLQPRQATARVHLATGSWIRRWRNEPAAVMIARADLRTAEERSEFAALRAAAIESLEELGHERALWLLDRDLPVAGAVDPPLPPLVGLLLVRMEELGGPAAVFVAPARMRAKSDREHVAR